MSLGLKDVSREKFIESNLGLVHSCANRFRGKGIEYEEMYAAGCIGLVKAYTKCKRIVFKSQLRP